MTNEWSNSTVMASGSELIWSNSTVMASGSELITTNDPVQAAADLAEQTTTKVIKNLQLVSKASGLDAKLEEIGIKVNTEQAMKFLALLGAWQAWSMTKAYRKNIVIGTAAYLAYKNQEKVFGKKLL